MVSPAYTRASYVSPGIVGPVATTEIDPGKIMELVLMFGMLVFMFRAFGKMVEKK